MYEAVIKNLSMLAELVSMQGRTLMLDGGSDLLHYSAIALILILLRSRLLKKKRGRFSKPLPAANAPANNRGSDRFFERKRRATRKPCPNCAEQLPMSALICDACDYNFLAARPTGLAIE